MKYNTNNKPIVCMMTQSTCYRGTSHPMQIKGVLWHSTGCNNTNIKRYVQPDDDAADKAELLKIIGTNSNKNDWNHINKDAGLNAWIGKLADGSVGTVQTMPWDYKPWGCGGGCNNGWIQFEICEDALTDKAYFDKVYSEACELTAYLCKLYNIDPCGTVQYSGKTVPTILCHHDSYKLGLGSGHVDIDHWFPKFGKSMETVRQDVAKLLNTAYKPIEQPKRTATITVPYLEYGDDGNAVKALQGALIALGYDCGKAGADGDFGNGTKAAVIKYQQSNKLSADGVVGKDTWAKLLNN